jgi:hypothetical protein
MQVRRYTDLYPLMTPYLPGCDTPLVLGALQIAGRDFCDRARVWEEDLTAVNLVAEQVAYTLTSPYDAQIDGIASVEINTAAGVADGDEGGEVDADYYEFDPATNVLTLDDAIEPQTSVTSGLVVRVVFVPRLLTKEIAGWVLEQFGMAIMQKAMGDLQGGAGKPWSNPVESARNLRRYESGVDAAKNRHVRKGREQASHLEA